MQVCESQKKREIFICFLFVLMRRCISCHDSGYEIFIPIIMIPAMGLADLLGIAERWKVPPVLYTVGLYSPSSYYTQNMNLSE